MNSCLLTILKKNKLFFLRIVHILHGEKRCSIIESKNKNKISSLIKYISTIE